MNVQVLGNVPVAKLEELRKEEEKLPKHMLERIQKPVKKWPPPMPEIENKRILNQVFTHKSVANKRYYLSRTELLQDHNERLEFIGDAILNYTMSDLVFRRFSDLPEGDMTTIRSQLVCNNTLWEWATAYELDKRLKTEFDIYSEPDGKRSKLIADVMEAYIGGLCMDSADGPAKVRDWLFDLVEPLLQQIIKDRDTIEPINKEAKNDLYVRIGSMETRPEYITVVEGDNLNPFTVECRMGDEILGVGTGPNTKEAGLRAAMKALKNEELLEKYAEIRRRLPRNGGLRYEDEHNNNSHYNQHDDRIPNKKMKISNSETDSGSSASVSSGGSVKAPKLHISSGPKDSLYSLVGSAQNRPNYVSQHINGEYYTIVYMKDEELGRGRGKTKKEAEQSAAEMALKNTEAVSRWKLQKASLG